MIPSNHRRWTTICVCLGLLLSLAACTSAPPADTVKAAVAVPAANDVRAIHPPALDLDRKKSLNNEALPVFESAMQAYAKKDYGKASVALRDATMKAPDSAEARFFLGICYLMTNDTDAAIAELKTATALGNADYKEDAHYFLAQAFARKRDSVNASRELDRVIEMKGKQADRARTLLEVVNVASR